MELFGLLLVGLVALASAEKQRPPRTLHERTCIGQWMPAVHLHGICILDVTGRSNCTEIDRLFEVENEAFDPIPLKDVPELVLKRALQENALRSISLTQRLCANIDRSFVEPKNNCPAGFYPRHGKCYTATKRRISYEAAQQECRSINATLVTEFKDDITGLLEYLVGHYVEQDTFTGYRQLDDIQNYERLYGSINDNHVEVDYETFRLQYVIPREKRAFICVVDEGVSSQALYNYVKFPVTPDDVLFYDPHPVAPPSANVERYLVDLLQFECPRNLTILPRRFPRRSTIVHRADLSDFDDHIPYGCHYKKSRGNVIIDLNSPTHEPRELQGFCKHLVRLYRVFDKTQHRELFSVHEKPRHASYGDSPRYDIVSIGYCSKVKGDCGASIPLSNPGSDVPECYLFESHRDLDHEINEREPLRYAQVASRVVPIYSSYHEKTHNADVQLDENADSKSTKPKILGNVISPLFHHQLDPYCKSNLIPLYHVYDLKEGNSFLTTSKKELLTYRNRDHYSEEELLGYCSHTSHPGYCGSTQPLHHYRYINNRVDRHFNDAYYNTEQPNILRKINVEHDILCYLF